MKSKCKSSGKQFFSFKQTSGEYIRTFSRILHRKSSYLHIYLKKEINERDV